MNQKVKLSFFLCMIGIISLTFGTSFSFFDFQNGDSNDNILISGKLAFSYTDFGLGNEINLMDTTPKSDSLGKTQINNGNSFDFKITSNSNKDNPAFYEVTIRKNKNSTLDDKAVKLYLTELDGNWEQEILLDTLSELKQTDKVDKEKYVEKIIYQGQIPANSGYYEKNFRLRIWVDEDYLYSNQDFSAMINVYSNETVVMSANEIKPTQTETVIEEEPLPFLCANN